MAAFPTAPAPPVTMSVRPATDPPANTQRWAVMKGMPSPAPCANEMPSGSGTAWCAGTQVNWAAVPFQRPAAAW